MKVLSFVKKVFVLGLTVLSRSITGALNCVSMNNQECKIRTNETRYIKWHKTCKCIGRLDKIICNRKQGQNEDKCRCECKELIDKVVCDKGYVWNPSNCECECDKSCSIGEYLDYSSCKCKKKN